jgi:ABC-type amino acid transport substrate-binding protein
MQDGEPAGLACEAALALAAGAGFEPATVLVSRAEALRRLASGEADMAVMTGGPPSGAAITNLGPVAVSRFIVLGRAGTALRTPRDLPGKTVATVRGAPEDPALSTRCGVAVLPVANAANGLKLLLAGRVDAVAGERLVLLQAAAAMNLPAKPSLRNQRRPACGDPFGAGSRGPPRSNPCPPRRGRNPRNDFGQIWIITRVTRLADSCRKVNKNRECGLSSTSVR